MKQGKSALGIFRLAVAFHLLVKFLSKKFLRTKGETGIAKEGREGYPQATQNLKMYNYNFMASQKGLMSRVNSPLVGTREL